MGLRWDDRRPSRRSPATPSHYQVLGTTPTASTTEIRQAYRDLARRLHPDRHAGASAAQQALAERRMREVNEAWRVLGNPSARRGYDAAQAPAGRRPPTSPTAPAAAVEDDDLVEVAPALGPVLGPVLHGLPYVIVLGLLAFIFVFTAYAAQHHDSSPSPRTGPPPSIGACITVRPGPTTSAVPCATAGAFRVMARIDEGDPCPAGAEPRRLATDRKIDCLVPAR